MIVEAYTGTLIKKKELDDAIFEAFGDNIHSKRIKVGSRIGGEDKRIAVYPFIFIILSYILY